MARKATLSARAQHRPARLRPTTDPAMDVCVADAGDLPLEDGSAPRKGLPCRFTASDAKLELSQSRRVLVGGAGCADGSINDGASSRLPAYGTAI